MSRNFPQNEINAILSDLGITEKAIVIYLELLKTDYATPTQLSKRTDVNRTSVYDVIQELTSKGLVSNFKKNGRLFFGALDPSHLANHLRSQLLQQQYRFEEQMKSVESVLPALLSMRNTKTSKPTVAFFEGSNGMREAYEDTLTAHEPIRAYANVETMHNALPSFFPEYYKRRTDRKVFIRAILAKNTMSLDRAVRDQEEMRESRFLPNEYSFTPEVNLYDNKMLVASWTEKMAVLITSDELVGLQKLTFDLLWNTLPRKPL